MNAHTDPAVEQAIANVDQTLAEKIGVPYLLDKLAVLLAEHRCIHNIPEPSRRDEGLEERRGRYLIHEA